MTSAPEGPGGQGGLAERLRGRTRWLGHSVSALASTGSTNDDAAAAGRTGAPHGLVVIAEAQTRGRGRQGHRWYSPPGENLYVSVLLRPALSPAAAPPITLAAGVAVCDALNAWGARASIKWPNDLLAGGKKVAGILTEMSTHTVNGLPAIEQVVVGIGVNLNAAAFPPDLAEIATSLRRERGGEPVDRVAFAADLLALLEQRVDELVASGNARTIAAAWTERAASLGRRITVVADGQTRTGIARGVDDQGALMLEEDGGTVRRIVAGEIADAEVPQ